MDAGDPKGGGGGGGWGGGICRGRLLVVGGPVEGGRGVGGVEPVQEEAEEDEGVDEGLVGGQEEVGDLVRRGFGGVALVRGGGGPQGKAPPQLADVVGEQLDQLL